jgi:uncharacterized repeat protein (TIGR03847 family)
MNKSYQFDEVDHFTVGAVGEPGRRVFMLQASSNEEVVTLKAEKGQIRVLAGYLGDLVAEAARPGHLPEDLELRSPIEIAWVAGELGVTYDETRDRVIIAIDEFTEGDETGEPPARAVFAITREQAAAVAIHGTSLVESGRPPCPLCGFPIDPSGHACPRTNGNRPPQM